MLRAYVLQRRFPRDAKAHRSLHLTDGSAHVHACSHTNAQKTRRRDSMAPKTTIKQRLKWHPPVTIPTVAASLCLLMYQMFSKRTLNWTTPLNLFCIKGEWKAQENNCVCVCLSLWAGRACACVCVKPLPSRDALFKMLLWYLCLLKGLGFL